MMACEGVVLDGCSYNGQRYVCCGILVWNTELEGVLSGNWFAHMHCLSDLLQPDGHAWVEGTGVLLLCSS